MNFARHIHSAFQMRARLPARALRGASLALVVLLAACGFHMRGVTPLPFDSLYIGIPDTTRFGAEVRRAIRAASPETKQVNTIKDAQAQLQVVANNRSMREVSLNAQGRVEEYELGIQFTFRVIDAQGHALLPDTTLEAYREMPYDDQVVQAKEGQAETLYRSMQTSLVSRLVRRLTSADVRAATEKAKNAKPGDEEGPVYDVNPPKPSRPQPSPQPGIITGPQLLDSTE
jgi:LPS-assembly lipoprotein